MMRTQTHLLVSLLIPQDELRSLSTAEMNQRNIPTAYRPDRTPARIAKMLMARCPFPNGPLSGCSIRGGNKFGGYYIASLGGNKIADIKANGTFVTTWHIEVPGGEEYLQNLVTEVQDNVDREGVRRIFLAWIQGLGFDDTGVPGLYAGDIELRDALEQVIDALPEASWTVWEAKEV